MSDITKDHLGREVSAEDIVKQLAVMLGWGNTPPWHVLERDLAAKLARLKALQNTSQEKPQDWELPKCSETFDGGSGNNW